MCLERPQRESGREGKELSQGQPGLGGRGRTRTRTSRVHRAPSACKPGLVTAETCWSSRNHGAQKQGAGQWWAEYIFCEHQGLGCWVAREHWACGPRWKGRVLQPRPLMTDHQGPWLMAQAISASTRTRTRPLRIWGPSDTGQQPIQKRPGLDDFQDPHLAISSPSSRLIF